MQEIKKPKNKKSLTKVKEQWFQEGHAFKQIIDYNKVTGGSMWTKEQQADLDAREVKLNNKIDDVESRLNNKIEANAQAIKENHKEIQAVKTTVDQILSIIKVIQSNIKVIQEKLN